MAANNPAPIACTLFPVEFKDRAARINKLAIEALITHHVQEDTAHLLYRLEAKDAVEQLVRQEQACCGFLSFEIMHRAAGIAVRITAPEDAKADAAALFAHFAPSSQAQPDSTTRVPKACGCGVTCGS